jgi:hypothetical protein
MISPISSSSQVQAITTNAQKPATPPAVKPAEDTVKLSPQAAAAAAASKDVDHDGDSR